jgi:hypothetical protein
MTGVFQPSSERHAREVVGHVAHDRLPGVGGSGHGDVVDSGVVDEPGPDVTTARNHVQDTRWEIDPTVDEVHRFERRRRREFARLDHDRVPRDESQRKLTDEHRDRGAPRDDPRDDAVGVTHEVDRLSSGAPGDDVTLDTAVPLEQVAVDIRRSLDLALGYRPCLASFGDQRVRERLDVVLDDGSDVPKGVAPLFGGARRPVGLCGAGRAGRPAHLVGCRRWDGLDLGVGRWVTGGIRSSLTDSCRVPSM